MDMKNIKPLASSMRVSVSVGSDGVHVDIVDRGRIVARLALAFEDWGKVCAVSTADASVMLYAPVLHALLDEALAPAGLKVALAAAEGVEQ